jgi:hypothetical protein
MINRSEMELTLKDHEKAFTEVSFLLDMLVKTIDIFVGKASPSFAVAAGKNMARNLPIYLSDPSPEEALEELVSVFSHGLDISGHFNSDKAIISLKQCPIRDVCTERGMAIDGQACQMFHYYVAGIMSALTSRLCRPTTVETGDKCSFRLAFGKPRT